MASPEDCLKEVYGKILTDVKVSIEGDIATITGIYHVPMKFIKLTFVLDEPVLEPPLDGPR